MPFHEIFQSLKGKHLETGALIGRQRFNSPVQRLRRVHGTDSDIKKLFIGKEQAGSITRDASALTIKIRTVALSNDKESRLRSFVQQLLLDPE